MTETEHQPANNVQGEAAATAEKATKVAAVEAAKAALDDDATAGLVDLATHPMASPDELSKHVDDLIQQLEGKFNQASDQIIGKLNDMTGRMEQLEATMSDMLHSLGSSGDDVSAALNADGQMADEKPIVSGTSNAPAPDASSS